MQLDRGRTGDGAPVSAGGNCCGEFTRSQMLHAAASEAGKGLPAIEPGMPTPAGTGLSRRSLLAARSRSGAGGLRQPPGAAGLRCRDRPGRPAGPDPGFDLPRRRPRRDEPARPDRRPATTAGCDRSWPCARTGPCPSARTTGCAGIRRPRAPGHASTTKARSRSSRRSATPGRTSPTSPRATSTRSARSRSASAPAGSAATSTRSETRTTRFRASRSTARCRRRWPPRAMPVASLSGTDGFGMSSRLAEPINTEMFDSFARLGRARCRLRRASPS